MISENNYKVYQHINKETGKRYIGCTGLLDVVDRWQNGQGYRNQPRFFEDILLYGWQNFDHEIIADGLTKKQAKQLETEYIINLETWKPEKGYNSYIANKKVEDNIVVVPNNPVICVETGKVYKNIYSATKAMNLSSPFCITRVINNPSKRSRGYHWIQPEQPKEEIDNDIKA